MQQDKSNPQEQIKNYGRRSRKDEEGRDYVCGCGKSYLSYPALYTHIKTKHDGHRPEGTYKIGIASGTRRINSTNSNNSNAQNTINGAAGNLGDQPMQYFPRTKSSQQGLIASTPVQKSRICQQILTQLQKLTKLQDFKILSQLQLQLDSTHPDNRIKLQNVGEAIYQNYNELILASEKHLKCHFLFDNQQLENQEEIQNQQSNQESHIQRWTKINYKTQLQTVLVVFLLGVGRSVSEELMDVYGQFAKMFRQCYYDHVEQIYQVCFKNNQYYQTKQRQRQREKERERERDNPYKCYEYSYPPSSSKSKTYNSFHSQPQHSSMISPSIPSSIISNLIINKNQCKYSPIICEFFIRVFVPSFNRQEYYKEVIELICNDFCTWMYRNKISAVQIGLNKKYDINKRQNLKLKIQTKIFKRNKKQSVEFLDEQYDNFQLNNQKANRKNKNQTQYRRGQKNKRKQRSKRGRYSGAYTTSYKPTSSRTKMSTQKMKNNSSNDHDQYDYQLQLDQLQNQQDNELINQNAQRDPQDQDQNNHQESYKIGQQIAHQMGVRDRSGSIHHYINGHNDHDENQPLQQYQQPPEENARSRNSRARGSQQNGGNNSASESNINEQQIQQYINP